MSYVAGLMDEVEFMDTSRDEAAAHPVYGPYATFEEAEAVAQTLSSDSREGVVMEVHWKTPDMKPHKWDCLCDACYSARLSRRPGETRREYRNRPAEDRW
jgi:hypothetical protein